MESDNLTVFYTDNTSLTDIPANTHLENVTMVEIISYSTLFFLVGLVGVTGNLMVIYIVFSDSKMRLSMTNMLIVNLSVADLTILLFGIPEIVMFMLNRGWLLGAEMCKIERYVLVTALYASVMTLLSLCIERYIAIVFPIKAHIFCTRRRTMVVIVLVWMFGLLCGLPTCFFNVLTSFDSSDPHMTFCVLIFPENHESLFMAFKYVEAVLFYYIPLILQIVCYVIIGRNLFIGVKELHAQTVRQSPGNPNSTKCSDTINARRGVIKMLVVSVLLYFLSYSPHQILLMYNTFSPSPFHQKWSFLVAVTVLAYVNSAGNPIIYCIFSEKYRRKFITIFSCQKKDYSEAYGDMIYLHSSSHATEYTTLFRKSTKRQTAQMLK